MALPTDQGQLFQSKGGVGHPGLLGSQPLKSVLGLAKGPNGFGSSSTAAEVAANWDGSNKVAIITGAASGLGLESAKVLVSRGAEVIMGVRDPAKAEQALAEVQAAAARNGKASSMALDLSTLASVKAFADEFEASGRKLHILMCNAGVMANPFALSKDGYELQFATNHLGHFLLTKLLLDKLVTTAKQDGTEGRIVVLTSFGHTLIYEKDPVKFAREFEVEGLSSSDGYDPFFCKGYGRSKLANVLFTRRLAEQLERQPVVAACCHPGFINNTGLAKHMLPWLPPGMVRKLVIGFASNVLMGSFSKSVPQGAATQVYLATAPKGEISSGDYYSDVNLEVSTARSHKRALAKQLWDVSEQLCKPFL